MASLGARHPLGDFTEDDSVVRLIRHASEALEPATAFRRRLRGEVLNLHVALREGLVAPRRTRAMSTIGRAVLLASLTLAVSVTAAGAAAQSAIPGELLYPVKRQLEGIRLQLASGPARGDLLEMAVGERLEELERLARAGEWTLVSAATHDLTAAEDVLIGAGMPPDAGARTTLDRRIERLKTLLASAPTEGRKGLQQALNAMSSPHGMSTGSPGKGPSDRTPPGQDPARPANGGPASNGSQDHPPVDSRGGGSTGNGAVNGNANGADQGNGPASEHAAPSHAPH